MAGLVRRHAKRTLAIALMISVYWFARLPDISPETRSDLASRFRFTSVDLPGVSGPASRNIRPVHASLDHISAWISSVGAAVALGELDGDAVANDVCYVDTRTDQVIVAPVPGTGDRFDPFALDPGPEHFDRDTMAPMGCLPGDLNEDGLPDLLVYYWGRPPIAFLRRQDPAAGISSDSFVARQVVKSGERWYTNALTRADVDGDGHVDIIIGNYFQDGARILDAQAGGHEQMQHSMSRAFNGGRNRILLWSGATRGEAPDVQFHEVNDALDIEDEPVATGWTLAIAAADLDGDLLPEIYFANDFGPDRLLHNLSRPGTPRFALLEGKRGFTTPASKVMGHDSFKGMGADFADFDGDGNLDLYVSNIAAEFALEESHFLFVNHGTPERMREGTAPFTERGESLGVSRSGWGWDSRLADFDNDGNLEAVQATGFVKGEHNRWPELHEVAMGNDELLSSPRSWHRLQAGDDLSGDDHNPFFVLAPDGRFYDVAPQLGLARPQVTRGIATADVDADGDLDFAIANQWAPSRFHLNQCPNPGRYLALRLLLPTPDQALTRLIVRPEHPCGELTGVPAIGAEAVVQCNGKRRIAHVDGGNGHSGVRSTELHFGLGDVPADARVPVTLRWRGSSGQLCRAALELTPGWHTVLLANRGEDYVFKD